MVKRISFVGPGWRELWLNPLVHHVYPYDQPQGEALAQFQFVVKESKS